MLYGDMSAKKELNFRWKANNGIKCKETRYDINVKQEGSIAEINFDTPFDLIYIWCKCNSK
jgi:hypothetical protein